MVERLPRNPASLLRRIPRDGLAAGRGFDSRPGLMLTREQERRLEEFCKNFHRQQDFAHGRKHMKKTVHLAEMIAEKEGANLKLVRIGAMVHQFHDEIGTLEQFLEVLRVDKETASKIVECAAFRPHRNIPPEGVSLEAKVVYDADALQVLGPHGIIREVARNVAARNKSLEKSVEGARDTESAFHEFLQTRTAREMIEAPHELMQEFWKLYDEWESI